MMRRGEEDGWRVEGKEGEEGFKESSRLEEGLGWRVGKHCRDGPLQYEQAIDEVIFL